MKKQLLAIAFLATGIASAQTWSQNFSSATVPGLPAGWMQNNVDGLTPNSSIASYNFGTNAGVTRDVTASFALPSMYSKCLITTSRYNPAGTSNDYVITPQFNVPANAVFNWDVTSFDPTSTGFYELRISTAGTVAADFLANPALFTIAGEFYGPDAWLTRGVSLSAYAGQNVYLAIRDVGNNRWQTAYDNMAVTVPANAQDGSITQIAALTRYTVGAFTQPISATLQQFGYAGATSAVVNYKVNNSATVTQTITLSPSMNYYQTATVNFTTPANFALGTNNVKVWVSHLNSITEVAHSNDTAYATVYVASAAKVRNALVEEFTSSTCVPCQNLNVTFDPMLNSNTPNTGGQVNVVKYQMNWPSPGNDPSYNNHGYQRRLFYGVTGIPDAWTNGRTNMSAHSQAEVNAAKAETAWADITASITVVGTQVTGNATVTPAVTVSGSSPLRTFQAFTQAFYNYPGASTTQKNYYHSERVMFPDGDGSATAVNTTDGTPFNVTTGAHNALFSATPAQMSNDFWGSITTVSFEYVVWVQDIVSGHILNSGSATYVNTTGLVKLEKDSKIAVYPNPAKDFAVVGIKVDANTTAEINIYDVTGKLVYNKSGEVTAGQNEIRLNTSEWATGTYNVIVTTSEGTLKDKLIVTK